MPGLDQSLTLNICRSKKVGKCPHTILNNRIPNDLELGRGVHTTPGGKRLCLMCKFALPLQFLSVSIQKQEISKSYSI